MSWTDERVTLLKKLWGEGKTAAEIAKELGGVTRNAVIGKAHRLKLSNRVSPIQQNKKPVAAPAPAKQQQNNKPSATATPTVKRKPRVEIPIDDDRERIPLTDLKAGQCRWPIGDPRDENFGFCGAPSISGLPYCLEHAQIAYQPATRNRIMKDQADGTKVTAKEFDIAKKAVQK